MAGTALARGQAAGNEGGMGLLHPHPAIRAILWFGFHASDSAMTKHFEAIADTLATGCLLSMNFNRIGATRWYQRFQSSRLFWIVSLGLVLGGDGLYAVNPACFYVIGLSVANLG